MLAEALRGPAASSSKKAPVTCLGRSFDGYAWDARDGRLPAGHLEKRALEKRAPEETGIWRNGAL